MDESYKIQSLEGLRGIMALWVVLGHISLTLGWHLPVIDDNALAVDVFILLSGFVIARLIDRKCEPYAQYIIRRSFRIFPLYLIVLAISTILLHVQLEAWVGTPFKSPANTNRVTLAQQGLEYLPAHLAAHIPLLQGLIPNRFLPGASYTIVGQAWSISTEWQFYLLAPLLLWVLVERKRWIVGIIVFSVLILASRVLPGGFLGNKIAQFGVGICSYLAFDRAEQRRWWLSTALGFGTIAIALSGVWQLLPFSIWAAVLLSSAMLPHRLSHQLAAMLSSRIPRHLGQISYSIYLVHMVPLYSSIFFLTEMGASRTTIQIGALLVTVIGCYVLSRITYALVEKPGIDLGAVMTKPVSQVP